MSVLFGVCTDFENIAGLQQAGFDYIEPRTYDIAFASGGAFHDMQLALERGAVTCEAINFFYPLDFRVVGEAVDLDKIHAYIRVAIERAGLLGVKNITIGSGPARRVPDGFPRETAFRQFGDQIRYAGELAGEKGISVSIEPIRPASTNLINNLAEGAALTDYVSLPNVKTMADINQMTGAGDTVDLIYRYAGYITHLHTIDVKNAGYPTDPDDPLQRELIRAYLTVNPGGRITVEGAPFTTVEIARQCLDALRHHVAWADAPVEVSR